MISILFLSANPDFTTRLSVEEEYNKIDEKIRSSQFGEQFNLVQRHAVSILKVQELLLRFKPNIVHFSGHGSNKGKLIFENSVGYQEEADPRALSKLFEIINKDDAMSEEEKIRLVILNACYSEKQARAIANYVDCVIGISDEIKDESATSFAESFYQALGFGKSLESAFKLGRNQLGLGGDPDERILRLKHREGINASEIILTTKQSRSSLSDDLQSYTVGRMSRARVLKEMNEWKESARKPYQILLSCKGKDWTLKLPVLLYRQDDSFTLVAKDGSGGYVEMTEDALASRITEKRPGHALLYVNGQRVFVKDLGSKNGTLVEDTTLLKSQSAILNVSDRFLIGNTFFIVKEIVTEVKHIAQSKDLWSSFRYTYVSLLDRLVEDNDLDSFITKLREFVEEFKEKIDPAASRELAGYIGDSKSWLGTRSSTEVRNKWKSKIRDLILRS